MKPEIAAYFRDGCGRCSMYQTPECKVRRRAKELIYLRDIILRNNLIETLKWGQPCYTHSNKNILILSALKDFASISFFKGVLLSDPEKWLVKPGERSQSMRYLQFRNLKEIKQSETVIQDFIREAIEIEEKGKKVTFRKNPEPLPLELQEIFKADGAYRTAFEALTPGRQRGYIIYFTQPKQSTTRIRRIEKYRQQILEGKGFHDDYKSRKK